jgi:predicted DNA-binding transcriptional regulator YafY
MINAIDWFEIRARDLDRARAFYETLLGVSMHRETMGPQTTLAVFPYQEPGIGYRLRPGCTLPPLMFTAPEAQAVVAAVRIAQPRLDAALPPRPKPRWLTCCAPWGRRRVEAPTMAA